MSMPAISREIVLAIHSETIGKFGGIDGNKRTGAALLGTYLRMSGLDFKPAHDELLTTILGVADGTVSYSELVRWAQSVTQ